MRTKCIKESKLGLKSSTILFIPPVSSPVCSKGHKVKVTGINPRPQLIDGSDNTALSQINLHSSTPPIVNKLP